MDVNKILKISRILFLSVLSLLLVFMLINAVYLPEGLADESVFIYDLNFIIFHVELRWLIPVFILAIILYSNLEYENKIPKYFLIINNVILFLFALKTSMGLFKATF